MRLRRLLGSGGLGLGYLDLGKCCGQLRGSELLDLVKRNRWLSPRNFSSSSCSLRRRPNSSVCNGIFQLRILGAQTLQLLGILRQLRQQRRPLPIGDLVGSIKKIGASQQGCDEHPWYRGFHNVTQILLKVVRVAGVEPTTFAFGGRHSIQLSYTRRRNLNLKYAHRGPNSK